MDNVVNKPKKRGGKVKRTSMAVFNAIMRLLTIDVDANGRKVRTSVIALIIAVATIVGGLVVLERAGIIDDIKTMVLKKEARR